MKQVEHKLGGELEEELRRMYVDANLPAHTIANLLDISYDTTLIWLLEAGIYSRRLKVD